MQKQNTLTIRQVANLTGKKVRTIREWIRLGKIKGMKDDKSKRWYFTKEEVEEIVNGHKN